MHNWKTAQKSVKKKVEKIKQFVIHLFAVCNFFFFQNKIPADFLESLPA